MEDKWPKTTGQVANLLGVSEVRVSTQLRLRKVNPPILLGRRAWGPDHVLAVARTIGKDGPAIVELCRAAAKGGAA